MRLTGSRTYYRASPPKMPPGLMELMEGLTKEVLKHNPSDVYGFCAGHMQQLLDKRDGPSSKKSLSLEEKIAKAQKKVREKAAIRRQEYDTNLVLQEQNHTSSNTVKDLSEPDGLSILGKDNITQLECNEVPQNMLESPIDQEQVLKDFREQEISLEPMLKDAVIENNVKLGGGLTEENYVDSGSINLQYSEKGESVCELESSYASPTDLVIANDLSENSKPDAEPIGSELIDIVPDTFLFHTTTDTLNENQKDDLVTTDVNTDIKFENFQLPKIESKESLAPDSAHNVPKDKAEDKTKVEISKNKSESIDKGPLENLYDNKTIIEDLQISNKLEHESSSPHESVNNLEQFSQRENGRLSGHTEDIQMSNESTNFQTDGNTDVIDSPVDVPQADKPKHSEVLNLGKDIKEKYEDNVQPFTNATNDGNVSVAQEHPADKEIKTNITKEVKQTPEIDTQVILPPTGVDGDIQTMVTENLINDSHELNNYENDFTQVKTVTPHDNVFQESENKPHLQSNSNKSLNTHDNNTKSEDKEVVNFTEEVNSTIDTNEDDMIEATTSTDIIGKTQNENQGSNMDLETAAITIQKVFRNFLFKSRGSTFEDTANDEVRYLDEDDKNKEDCDFSIANALNIDRRAHGITRMDTVLQTVNEEKSLSLSTDDSSTLSSAATIIQAHVRGFLVRNKLNSNKTISTNSLAASNSNEPSLTSIEAGCDQNKNKTVLNIHIVPEGDNSLSRDESLMTSMDLSLDSSPPSSTNLHPLGYDKSERRKQLKREDAIQSISPPSNNSGKLSEDLDSVKELSLNGHDTTEHPIGNSVMVNGKLDKESEKSAPLENGLFQPVINSNENIINNPEPVLKAKEQTVIQTSSDETDVVTPSVVYEDLTSSNLLHSSEFHDALLPTRVSRSDTSVVSGE